MVKADAYGCGGVEISRALNKWGVEDLGVAYTQEGVELRQNGIKGSIMVMNPLPQDFSELVHHHLEPEISNLQMLTKWVDFFRQEKLVDYPIHLEVDTGMKRLGFMEDDIGELTDILRTTSAIKIKSLYSHLSSIPCPADDDFTLKQLDLFDEWSELLNAHINYPIDRHILNSAGILRFPDHKYDMVRLGIGLYGVGLESHRAQKKLKPVQFLYASISQVKEVKSGESIGYDRKGKLPVDGRIAILNIGYADGLLRLAGNGRFSVRIGDKLCPVVGSVCMDMTMVDVSACPEAQPGMPVEIYGEHHPVIHLAEACETIPYEILTANHQRLHRVLVDE